MENGISPQRQLFGIPGGIYHCLRRAWSACTIALPTGLERGIKRDLWATGLATEMVDAGVADNAIKPCSKGGAVKCTDSAKRREKSVLGDIGGDIRVAHHA